MMKRAVMAVVMAWLAGCVEPKTCTSNTDCTGGAVCDMSSGSTGLCREVDGGLSAGGAAGGRAGGAGGGAVGGGVTAGGSAGGAAGGMVGGGSSTDAGLGGCDGGCPPYAVCVAAPGQGRCAQGRLTVTDPNEGAAFAVNAMVPVLVTLELEDGGAFPSPPRIPVFPSWSQSQTAPSGTTLLLNGAGDGGSATLDFGWDGGPAASRRISFESCERAACAEYEFCVPTSAGGRCVAQPWDVSISSPPDDSLETNAASVTVRVVVDGGNPVSVPVTGTGVPGGARAMRVSGRTGEYDYQWALTVEGNQSVTVGWPAGGARLAATRTVRRDTVVPTANVLAPGQARRDERVRVQVTSSEVPRAGTLVVTLAGSDAGVTGAGGVCDGGMCQDTYCGCFEVDMAAPSLAGLTGVFGIGMRLEDRAGNAVASTAMTTVSRVRWTRDISLAGTATPLHPVAVSRTGLVLAAVQERSGSAGRVVATRPDGAPAWEAVTAGTVTAGPVVGSMSAWVGTNDGMRTGLVPIALSNGAAAASRCELSTAANFTGDLALAGATEAPLGIRAGILEIAGSPICPSYSLVAASPPPSDTTSRPALAVQIPDAGIIEAFVAYEGDTALWKARLTVAWSDQGALVLPAGPQQTKSLFFNGTGRVGGGGGVGNGTYFMTSAVGPLMQTVNTVDTLSVTNGGPAVHGLGSIFYGTSTGVVGRISAGMFLDGGTAPTGLGNLQEVAPVLGPGLVYLVGRGGGLSVRRQSDLSELWAGSIASLSGAGAVGQLALDVYRDGSGAKQCPQSTGRNLGVLYVLTKSGATATLRAVIVDSPGLDSSAPWPKYQRDNGNTGNINSDLSAWTCP